MVIETKTTDSCSANIAASTRSRKTQRHAFINTASKREKSHFSYATKSANIAVSNTNPSILSKSSLLNVVNNKKVSNFHHDAILKTSSATSLKMTRFADSTSITPKNNSKEPSHKKNSSFLHDQRIATLIPASLCIGGAAFVYSAAFQHPSSKMSPQSLLYMLLLSITYCIQPTLSKQYIDKRINVGSLLMVEEGLKLIMASCLFFFSCSSPSSSSWRKIINDWDIRTSLIVAAIPAFIYSIQGILTYTSYQHLNAVTFNGLSQTKMLSAAICCYLLLGKSQSKFQIVALLLLVCSALLFQGILSIKSVSPSSKHLINKEEQNKINGTELLPKADEKIKKNHQKYLFYGVLPCITATFLSGLAGALSQKGLQMTGGANGRNPYLYTMEVSFFTGVFLCFNKVLKFMYNKIRNYYDFEQIKQKQAAIATASNNTKSKNESSPASSNYFQFWSWKTLVPIFIKASGGLLTALVHKYAGSVLKGFALVLGLVFSGVLQSFMDEKPLSYDQLFGTMLVLVSTWLHFTCPPVTAAHL